MVKAARILGGIHVRQAAAVVEVQHNIAQFEPYLSVYADVDRLVAIRRLSDRNGIRLRVELFGGGICKALGRGAPAVKKRYIGTRAYEKTIPPVAGQRDLIGKIQRDLDIVQ